MAKDSLCSVCHEKATVFVSAVSGGILVEKAFCLNHAAELGLLDDKAFDLIPLSAPAPKKPNLLTPPGKKCPTCGFSQREFERRGRVGCHDCYTSFGDEIRAMLPKMHAGTLHLGKLPQKALQAGLVGNRIAHYRTEMERAIANEEFETAARFRDKISELETRLGPAEA